MKKTSALLSIIALSCVIGCREKEKVNITGELKTWHNIILTFSGPGTSEYDTINPFTEYLFNVEFSNNETRLLIPGFFAADGNAGESSAKEGNKWRVHFCPPSEGEWGYRVIFLKGRNAAVSGKGEECYINGMTGSIKVTASDKLAPDFRSKGRLKYTGGSYLVHGGTGEAFLKGGTDSPENLLGYADFDGTYYGGNNVARAGEATPHKGLHHYEPHIKDWKEGDPSWKNGKGKGLIGGLNYLSSKGVNSIYFLTLNIMGDGDDVWPYTDRNERYRFDCSKLDQWEKVFTHAEKLGIMLHVVLQETENQCLLDCGKVDVQRKLYLRELVARFSHHLSITWNLGEEQHAADFSPYGQTYQDTKLTAKYLGETDPYDNFIVIHTHSNMEKRHKDMSNYLGFKYVQGPSIQVGNVNDVHEETKFWLKASADSSHAWVVDLDEIGPSWKGALPDQYDPAHDTIRYKVLWGNLMAGGAGTEWYFGYKYPHSDLACEDWRSREKLWEQTKIAIDFFHTHLNMEKRHKDMSNYLGFKYVQGPSIQVGHVNDVHEETKFWLKASADSSHAWVVDLDEIGPSWKGALPDQYDPAHDTIRYKVLWGNLMAGGAGTEWYFGYKYPHSDLACEDWRSREKLWEQTKIAIDFFHTHLPFTDMKSADELTTEKTDYCFAKEGRVYAIYLPDGKTTDISLPEGKYNLSWFNPRRGGELIKGNPEQLTGGKKVPVGTPPDQKDWVCLIKAE